METTNHIDEDAFQRFLRTGQMENVQERALAAAIDRNSVSLVQHSLDKALEQSRRLVRLTATSDGPVRLSAVRALGRAALMSGNYSEAEQAYRQARAMVVKDPLSRGRIDRTLIDVYMYLGEFGESKRRARLALKTFEALQNEGEVAKARVNFGNLLHRQDRHAEAESLYRKAAEYFERVDDDLSAARCYFNRANTLVQMFEFDEAENLYGQAEETYRRHGRELDATDSRWGISWLHMLEGKFHVALRELQDCEQRYIQINVPLRIASCELDRAEVYLNLNLFEEARVAARAAERQFRKLGVRYERAKAALYRATAAFALGSRREGHASLRRAREGFERDRNHGFLGAVELLAARAALRPADTNRHLRMARRYFDKAQLPLWQAMCDLHAVEIESETSAALRRLEDNRAAHIVPHIFAGWKTALGDSYARSGANAAAAEAWRLAAQRLDAVRASLPPVELQSTFGRRTHSPHARLVSVNLADDPLQAAVWSERYKTAGIWSPLAPDFELKPARRNVQESLRKLAEQVSVLSRQISDGGERSIGNASTSRSIQRLQRRIREGLLEVEGTNGASGDDSKSIARLFRRVSRDLPVVQFHFMPDRLIGFVHEDGNTRICEYPDGAQWVVNTMARWRFQLETVALADRLNGGSVLAEEKSFFDEVGEWLWRPLEIPSSCSRVLIIPEGELTNLPWYALRVANAPLLHSHEFVLAPSMRHYCHARRRNVKSNRVDVMVGSTDDLPNVEAEVAPLMSMSPGAYRHDPCRREDWPSCGSARIWHYAGHAHLNRRNPFYSFLALHDGPLFAADFRMKRCQVDLVTLAACQSGTHVSLPGEESSGLVRSLLEMGARNVIAGHWPVADAATSQWMRILYNSMDKGMPVASAAREAAGRVSERYPSAYHWAAFAVFGAGA